MRSSATLARLSAIFLASSVARADDLSFDYDAYAVKAALGPVPHHSYMTSKETSPLLHVNVWKEEMMSKHETHIFIRNNGSPDHGTGRGATPLIIQADDLSAVYMDRSFPAIFDARVQQNNGQDYLTFFGGPCLQVGLGNGTSYVYDTSYNLVYKVVPQNLSVLADLHEFQMNGDGTAILTAYDVHNVDVSMVEGGQGRGDIRDSMFQELDLETNEVLFQWRASDHIPLTMSTHQIEDKWDFFHLNSVEKTKDGNYLLSARHTNSLYLIDGKTGDPIWTLGGKDNKFKELEAPNGQKFSNPLLTMKGQHHARFYPGSDEKEITFFDNHALTHFVGCNGDCSRGIHLRLDTSDPNNMTAQILHEYLHPKQLRSGTQGSVHRLDNGNIFVGWGGNPSFTEHTPDGECILDVEFSPWRSDNTNHKSLDNYRAYRQAWKAEPHWDPAIAATSAGGAVTAYLSWNGATEVRYWALYACDSEGDLIDLDDNEPVAQLPRAGFETTVHLGYTQHKFLRAAALDVNSELIRYTGVYNIATQEVTENKDLKNMASDNSGNSDSDSSSSSSEDNDGDEYSLDEDKDDSSISQQAAKLSDKFLHAVKNQSRKSSAWPILFFGIIAAVGLWFLRNFYRRRAHLSSYRRVATDA